MIEQKHCCTICKRNTVKLYRYYGNFLRDSEIFCRAHAPPGHIEHQNLVPLIENEDGSVGLHLRAAGCHRALGSTPRGRIGHDISRLV